MGSLQVEETSAYCTVNHRASASNYQLSNMKRPAPDSSRRPRRLQARTLIATPVSPLHIARKQLTIIKRIQINQIIDCPSGDTVVGYLHNIVMIIGFMVIVPPISYLYLTDLGVANFIHIPKSNLLPVDIATVTIALMCFNTVI